MNINMSKLKNKSKVSIVSLLFNFSPKLLVLAVAIGALAGFLYSLIIPFAIKGIQGMNGKENATSEESMLDSSFISGNEGSLFFSVVVVILFAKTLSVILVNNIAKSATADLKVNIVKKINNMKLDDVEKIGFPRLLNVLTGDVVSVAQAAIAIPMIVVSSVTVMGMLGYLAFLNIIVFTVVLAAIFVGVFIFQAPVKMVQGFYEKARECSDIIQEGTRGLVFGAFELKLNKQKSKGYIEEEIIKPIDKWVKLHKVADAILHLASTASDLLSFFIIGGIVFILPYYVELPMSDSFGIVMVLLYISGPIAAILGMLQHLQQGKTALKRMHLLEEYEEEDHGETSTLTSLWTTYTVQDISYTYGNNKTDASFHLKPISLSFQRGQINFIVGGNGSGKSTLSKLLSLHYRSNLGIILFDDCVLDNDNIALARERISVIYSDYYLFRKLYRKHSAADEIKVKTYLNSLGLTGKTEFIDGYFTTTNLSDGQRRRLALLVALIEDKDIYIFDEWAADQDPEFKKIFYQEILPKMKSDNKLVIVITHDDRYFDCADRVIFMEDGGVVAVKSAQPSKLNVSSSIELNAGGLLLDAAVID